MTVMTMTMMMMMMMMTTTVVMMVCYAVQFDGYWAALSYSSLQCSAAMQQFALDALLHESLHAADISLQNLAASVQRFQDDYREMFLAVLHLLSTYC